MSPSSDRRDQSSWRLRILALLAFVLATVALYSRFRNSNEARLLVHESTAFNCTFDGPEKRVAIVGAGSAGASAAYYLSHYTSHCPNIVIDVYERNDYIGGRSTTVDVYDDPTEPVELGASIFVQVNHNLVHAVQAFNLSIKGGFDASSSKTREVSADEQKGSSDEKIEDTIGVWDGTTWRYMSPRDSTGGWWTMVKLLWQYGTAPLRTYRLMKSVVNPFLRMYSAPIFPFANLTEAVGAVGLADVAAVHGAEFLDSKGISQQFAQDIIQASTRVNYASDLVNIHGVETMVCMATDGAMSIDGGNWQIFTHMLAASDANIYLNRSVAGITYDSATGKYSLSSYFNREHGAAPPVRRNTLYDEVILAAPLQFSSVSLSPPPQSPIPEIPYTKLHVTLFTSPFRLDPVFFKLPPGSSVPKTVLTTTVPYGQADSPYEPDFYSISTLRLVSNPQKGGRTEYLYKIFSAAPLTPEFFHSLLETDPSPLTEAQTQQQGKSNKPADAITWIHEKIWHSYPIEHPCTAFDDIQVKLHNVGKEQGGRIWYTSSIEPFISTMETSSLMGANVARLIVDEWISNGKDGRDDGIGGESMSEL